MIDPQCQTHIFRDKERLHKLNPKPELPIHCSPYPPPPSRSPVTASAAWLLSVQRPAAAECPLRLPAAERNGPPIHG